MDVSSAENKANSDATAVDSDASTVSMGDERSNASTYFETSNINTNQDSFLISDLDDSILISSDPASEPSKQIEQQIGDKKVGVLDIFNKIKPSKVRKETEGYVTNKPVTENANNGHEQAIQPIVSEEKPVEKTGITAKDILMGIRPTKKKEKEEHIEEIENVTIEDETLQKEIKQIMKSGVTARDILTGMKKKERSPVPDDVEMIEVISSGEEETTQPQKKTKKNKLSKKNKERDVSFMVTLKYRPRSDRIADLENKIRSSMANSVSAKDLLKQFGKKEKQQMLVSLKVDKEKLKTLVKPDDLKPHTDSFFTKGSSKVPGAKSYLDLLSYKPIPAKNPIHKLKETAAPAPTKEQLHVTPESEPIQHRNISLNKKTTTIEVDDLDYSIIGQKERTPLKENEYNYSSYLTNYVDILSVARSRVPTLESDLRYSRFLKLLENADDFNKNNDLWCDYFKPQNSREVLFDSRKAKAMRQWLKNSFQILKKKTKRPNLKRLGKVDQDEFVDFIANEEENDTEDESYVPIMILSGPEGVGKTSAVYSMVEELSGYVYEINASQARGRKDIMANLKELSTTQLVHQNQGTSSNEFQKGVILFEDVDVLFESDKGFWSVMEHVLSISRRPIILTCTDIDVIPNNILECAANEDTLYSISRQPIEILSKYLFLIGLTKKVEIDEKVLEQIIIKNSRDLRRCISTLQVLCEVEIPKNSLLKISYTHPEQPHLLTDETSLKSLVQDVDRYSIADILDSHSKSLINHDIIENEILINDPYINEEELRTSPLPFELSLGSELREGLPLYPYDNNKGNINDIKKLDDEFLKTRLKESKRITRNNTMSMFDFDDNMDAKNIFKLPESTYITEVSPFFRTFSRYEVKIDHYNAAVIREKGQSVNELLSAGFLIKKKFSARNDMLLYEPLRYWNV